MGPTTIDLTGSDDKEEFSRVAGHRALPPSVSVAASQKAAKKAEAEQQRRKAVAHRDAFHASRVQPNSYVALVPTAWSDAMSRCMIADTSASFAPDIKLIAEWECLQEAANHLVRGRPGCNPFSHETSWTSSQEARRPGLQLNTDYRKLSLSQYLLLAAWLMSGHAISRTWRVLSGAWQDFVPPLLIAYQPFTQYLRAAEHQKAALSEAVQAFVQVCRTAESTAELDDVAACMRSESFQAQFPWIGVAAVASQSSSPGTNAAPAGTNAAPAGTNAAPAGTNAAPAFRKMGLGPFGCRLSGDALGDSFATPSTSLPPPSGWPVSAAAELRARAAERRMLTPTPLAVAGTSSNGATSASDTATPSDAGTPAESAAAAPAAVSPPSSATPPPAAATAAAATEAAAAKTAAAMEKEKDTLFYWLGSGFTGTAAEASLEAKKDMREEPVPPSQLSASAAEVSAAAKASAAPVEVTAVAGTLDAAARAFDAATTVSLPASSGSPSEQQLTDFLADSGQQGASRELSLLKQRLADSEARHREEREEMRTRILMALEAHLMRCADSMRQLKRKDLNKTLTIKLRRPQLAADARTRSFAPHAHMRMHTCTHALGASRHMHTCTCTHAHTHSEPRATCTHAHTHSEPRTSHPLALPSRPSLAPPALAPTGRPARAMAQMLFELASKFVPSHMIFSKIFVVFDDEKGRDDGGVTVDMLTNFHTSLYHHRATSHLFQRSSHSSCFLVAPDAQAAVLTPLRLPYEEPTERAAFGADGGGGEGSGAGCSSSSAGGGGGGGSGSGSGGGSGGGSSGGSSGGSGTLTKAGRLAVGTAVTARFQRSSRFFSGSVEAANPNGTYAIAFHDGDREANVEPRCIKVNGVALASGMGSNDNLPPSKRQKTAATDATGAIELEAEAVYRLCGRLLALALVLGDGFFVDDAMPLYVFEFLATDNTVSLNQLDEALRQLAKVDPPHATFLESVCESGVAEVASVLGLECLRVCDLYQYSSLGVACPECDSSTATGGPQGGVEADAAAIEACRCAVLTDEETQAATLDTVRHVLVGCRRRHLEALKSGFQGMDQPDSQSGSSCAPTVLDHPSPILRHPPCLRLSCSCPCARTQRRSRPALDLPAQTTSRATSHASRLTVSRSACAGGR